MRAEIINILNQFGECNFTLVVFDDEGEVVYRADKFLVNDENLQKNLNDIKNNGINEYLNRPKLQNPEYIIIDIEENSGSNKLACHISFYDMLAEKCQVDYELRNDYNINEIGIWNVDQETISKWGLDDSVIIDGLCKYLNVVKI